VPIIKKGLKCLIGSFLKTQKPSMRRNDTIIWGNSYPLVKMAAFVFNYYATTANENKKGRLTLAVNRPYIYL
jgi:hypothetical protein